MPESRHETLTLLSIPGMRKSHMKTKELVIGIKELEKGLLDFSNTLKAIEQGKKVQPKGGKINFVSLEAARSFFTPKRIELLNLIHHQEPQSLYELAKLAHRDMKNVQDDVDLLARVGLIDLEHEKQGRERTVPIVSYDNLDIRLQIAV